MSALHVARSLRSRPRSPLRLGAEVGGTGPRPGERAATDPTARGGAFYGPRFRMRGPAVEVAPPKQALDAAARAQLWTACEALTGVSLLTT